MVSTIQPRLLVHCRADVGEGPVYDPASDTLYWVDAPAGHLWRWDHASRDVAYREIGETLGSMALIDGGGFLLAARRGVLVLPGWNGLPSLWRQVEPDHATRFNDGRCDPDGRFVAGTAAHDPRFTGTLYRLDPDGGVAALVDGIGISNGLDWSPDGHWFYHVDTIAQTVNRYRWDAAAGVPSEPEVLIEVPSGDGLPAGLTVDAEGCLWLAVRGAGEVRRHTPDGRLLGAVAVPTPNVSGCAFGGPHRNELYITTAAQAAPQYGREGRLAGDVFVVTTPVRGQRRVPFPRHGIPAELLEPRPYELD
ncbi:SMP-30/gluconolactonase/LRE family protein [Jiangella endophytica]|uniref:SMP-30/gluconolactonase/LRE family protein n=1 Tax=Jiangella endophytica TaxID=1623398 RepID=UPI000E348E68|nr:SMP-30/gluconolactonase/LRE family protein [Jiangella endophytica]